MTKTLKLSVAGATFVVAISLLAYVGINAAFAASSLFGGATFGPGYVTLVSDSDPAPLNDYSGISFDDMNGELFSSLAVLSTDFDVTDDSCGGGSPRFSVGIDTDNDTIANGYVHIAIGPSPSFSGCTSGWQSTGNVIENNDAGRYDFGQFGGSAFTTYSAAPASVLGGKITEISIVVDGSWSAAATGSDGEQTVLIDNVKIAKYVGNYDFTPLPATLIVDDNLACPGATYTTIQDAVTAANSGDTIQICAGTYDQGANIIAVNKSLTFTGPNAAISPNGGSRVAEAIIEADNSIGTFNINPSPVTVVFEGLTFQTDGAEMRSDAPGATITLQKNIFTGARADGMYFQDPNLTVDDNLFTGYHTTGAETIQMGVIAPRVGSISITNNTWNDITGNGALNSAGQTGTVSGNTFDGVEYYGILVASDPTVSADLTISNNIFNNITNPTVGPVGNELTWGAGVRFYQANPSTVASVTGNTFSNSYLGVSVRASDSDITGANIHVNRNAITGNTSAGILNAAVGTLEASCNWWGNASGPGPVGPGTGDGVSANVDFSSWLTTSLLTGPCNGPLPPAPDVTVTIVKYVDGVHATDTNATGLSFPMESSWSDAGFPDGSGSFSLASLLYEAQTSPMDAGANYSTNEVVSGSNVGASCTEGKPFALLGYTASTTEANAALETVSPTNPALTNLTTDMYVIVWNEKCGTTLTLEKVVTNDDTGTELDTAWTLSANGPTPISGIEGNASVTSATVLPGAYDLSESGPAGYTASAWVCTGGTQDDADTVTIAAGENVTCVITNDDNAAPPVVPPPPANACNTPTIAPLGYTLQNGTTGSDNVTIAPFTMFVGKGGYDTVNGPADGNYIVCTGTKTDKITLGNGDFTISAGDGYNVIVTGNGAGYIEGGIDGDTITTGDGEQTIQAGNGYNKIITGNGDKNITAGIKNDQITTGSGNDVINAGIGHNNIKSGAGNDSITTGADNDTIDGGPDTDTCSAGGGYDSVVNCEA